MAEKQTRSNGTVGGHHCGVPNVAGRQTNAEVHLPPMRRRRPTYAFDAFEMGHDSEAHRRAGALLEQHVHVRCVAVWAGERPVLARHRARPEVRAVERVAMIRRRRGLGRITHPLGSPACGTS